MYDLLMEPSILSKSFQFALQVLFALFGWCST